MNPVAAKISWLLKTTFFAVALLHLQISPAQGLLLTVSNDTVNVSWPSTKFYYLLQSETNPLESNSWSNVGSASAMTALVSGGNVPTLTNFSGDNFVFTQRVTNACQFFRLQAPASVPVFCFNIFYDQLLEFSDSSTLVMNGFVHANGPIYTGPGTGISQTFNTTVTTTVTISSPANAGFTTNTWGPVYFNANPPFITNTPAFVSPFGTNNPHALIEMPPAGESGSTGLGALRLYNQAQVLLIVSNSVAGNAPGVRLILQSGYNGQLPGADPYKIIRDLFDATPDALQTNLVIRLPFLSLTNTFADLRESQTNLYVTQINLGQFTSWLLTNTLVAAKFGGGAYPKILYVADQRNVGTNKLAVVRLVNGARLPYNNGFGFTVATQNPLYVQGSYNTTVNGTTFATTLGSTTNGVAVPAALIADAITILSANWVDVLSSASVMSRNASSMTVNAGLISGIVPSTGTSFTNYSGGVQNLPRFLENWTGDTFTMNTSLVCLFNSQVATNQFLMPYSSSSPNGYYTTPTRNWGFDPNFNIPNKLPPGTPVYGLP